MGNTAKFVCTKTGIKRSMGILFYAIHGVGHIIWIEASERKDEMENISLVTAKELKIFNFRRKISKEKV